MVSAVQDYSVQGRRLINKDPISALTHFLGALAAIAGTIYLATQVDGTKRVVFVIYGVSMVALFSASSIYHFFDLGEGNKLLRKFDHMAIFLLIGGTYVPPLVHTLTGTWRIAMLALIGGLALAGVIFKLWWTACPRWLTAGIYLGMGWVILIPAHLVFPALSSASFTWLLAGGVTYSVGAIIYAIKRPNPIPGFFGFHEIWHLFVLAAAAFHFVFMLTLIHQPIPA